MYASSREEEEEVVGAQMCPSGKDVDTKPHILIVGGCKMHKEKRHMLEIRKIKECVT